MIKVLFVCHGNICRSPMAEFIFKDLVKEDDKEFHIESRATSREEIGNPVYPPAKRKLKEYGILCDGKVAKQITKEDYEKFDYIICMDNNNLRNIRYVVGEDTYNKISLLMEWTGEKKEVSDPWYTGDFETAYRDILKGCKAVRDKLYT
ncbi:MAG: low molecular weight phosphotyrosine protein phosphatase [Ruminococcaceae bacterium]|nr:low molecular weight phosphotyrosine protein phosphatase [Oscillospiraceae bacterium]